VEVEDQFFVADYVNIAPHWVDLHNDKEYDESNVPSQDQVARFVAHAAVEKSQKCEAT